MELSELRMILYDSRIDPITANIYSQPKEYKEIISALNNMSKAELIETVVFLSSLHGKEDIFDEEATK